VIDSETDVISVDATSLVITLTQLAVKLPPADAPIYNVYYYRVFTDQSVIAALRLTCEPRL